MDVQTIAFYLPQFHAIPENDRAYGKGFTEWTNVKKAVSLFDGHLQPKIPLNNNYYCLLDNDVMKQQVKLAKSYGIYGFCYYHYWFKNGKRLLEKPLELMLTDKNIDMPFCLCWANENWTKRWDGGNNEIIMEQDYDDIDNLGAHLDCLARFFNDERYIRIENKPLFVLYRPELIPNLEKYITRIREGMKARGFDGIYILTQYPLYYLEGNKLELFDGSIQFQPLFVQLWGEKNCHAMKNVVKKLLKSLHIFNFVKDLKNATAWKKLSIRSYDDDWNSILNYKVTDPRLFAGAFTDWDNTPRNKKGLAYIGANPIKFAKYFKQLVNKVRNEYTNKFIFINAWNEWAEGAYLEPDEQNRFGYLAAIKKALEE